MYLTQQGVVFVCVHMRVHARAPGGHKEAYFGDLVFKEVTAQGQNQAQMVLST